jgi:hypothetical protein
MKTYFMKNRTTPDLYAKNIHQDLLRVQPRTCKEDHPQGRPLGRVNFDLIISIITSVEEYRAVALYVDDPGP